MNLAAEIVFGTTALSTLLFFWNLAYYRPARKREMEEPAVSVLIPARNEERSIEASIQAALASEGVRMELIVADDHSADRTSEIVGRIAKKDRRVSLVSVPSLPYGWCGKQFACHVLSQVARYEVLCFIDADVRLAPHGLSAMIGTLQTERAALLSGFPKQETVSITEQMLIPLMHFLLLGFLPMIGMKKSVNPAYGAGCGQIFVADAHSYTLAGGHAAIKTSRHDGVTLPRAFRRAGLPTTMCDATRVASCRMYRSGSEVLAGLLKNASEGLAAPARILPFSLLLLIGQVCPLILLGRFVVGSAGAHAGWMAAVAVVLSYLPRLVAVRKFEQPLLGALLHPAAVFLLLAIQWYAFFRAMAGIPSVWKGRSYSTT